MKILLETHLWTRKSGLHFGRHQPPHLRIQEYIEWFFFNFARWGGHFSIIWLISPEKLIGASLQFYCRLYLLKEVPPPPVKFWQSFGSAVRIKNMEFMVLSWRTWLPKFTSVRLSLQKSSLCRTATDAWSSSEIYYLYEHRFRLRNIG